MPLIGFEDQIALGIRWKGTYNQERIVGYQSGLALNAATKVSKMFISPAEE